MQFPFQTKQQLLNSLDTFNHPKYAKTRNFIDGNVSHLSPYITHGVLTTKESLEKILEHHSIQDAEKFLMELVWKEFFMQVQMNYGNTFTHDTVREDKTGVEKSVLLPVSLLQANTGTSRVDDCINTLQTQGRLHNHKRMWLASRCCHWAKLDWKKLADRTYYHFLDGELSSNHLSRQRVNSTFANKPYVMNEGNLQKYRPGTEDSNLRGTYDEVSARLFYTERKSSYREEHDAYDQLTTPIQRLEQYTPDDLGNHATIQILTPWKLDEELLGNDIHTLIVLDEQFTSLHPWSQKRLDRILQRIKQYHVKFVYGDYQRIIHDALAAGIHVTIDQRYDPYYREIYTEFCENDMISVIPYPWIHKENTGEPVMKFFKYWNLVKRQLSVMI